MNSFTAIISRPDTEMSIYSYGNQAFQVISKDTNLILLKGMIKRQ